jgi:anti-sigma regulatory factor (Ser/Thr protein kinase)
VVGNIFKLIAVGLANLLVSLLFYLLNKKTRFASLKEWQKQVIYGLVFGGLAIMGTELGAQVNGATLNVRDVAPLCAGLIFGAPAGIIAGLIGGIERYFAPYWGAGAYTKLACMLATIFCGLFAAGLRKRMFDDKKPSWFYAFAIGVIAEVMHMLLIFLTHMDDINNAFIVVKAIAIPMILITSLSVTFTVLVIALAGREKLIVVNEQRQLAQSFQRWLLLTVLVAYFLTSLFTYFVQTKRGLSSADDTMNLNLTDVKTDIKDNADSDILKITLSIKKNLEAKGTFDNSYLASLASETEFDVSEINYVDANGIIAYSNIASYIGYNMNQGDGEQASEFYQALLVDKKEYYVQPYQPMSKTPSVSMKYAAYAISAGGFVQVGYDAVRFQKDIDDSVLAATRNRHVGENGYLIVIDSKFNLVSDPQGNEGKDLSVTGISSSDLSSVKAGTRLSENIYQTACYCIYDTNEGYYIIAVIPQSEVTFSTELSVYFTIFMEVVVFAMLFFVFYYLIKRLVVDNISKINTALNEITRGNLNVSVDVRGNAEFASLSDDINSTVVTLKGYIKDAAARIDKELEFAREIQLSALPSPLDGGSRFYLSAQMQTAKEVGGDFYDYFMIDAERLAIVIADVSGKGIPASLFMMKSKTLIKSLAQSGKLSPGKVLEKANKELCEGNEAEMFVTVWLGIYDFSSRKLVSASAGHEYPCVLHKGGKFDYIKDLHGLVLAGMDSSVYKETTVDLQPGDCLFVYTDGVTEATNAKNELFGDMRLLTALNSSENNRPETLIQTVMGAIDGFVGAAPQFDDITMVSLKIKDPEEEKKMPQELTLEATVANIDLATEFVDEKLDSYGCPTKEKMQINVAIDELFSNIAQYAYNPDVGPATLRVETKKDPLSVIITFIDHGVPFDPLKKKDPDITAPAEEREIGGLGIYMVKKTMDNVHYEYKDGANILTIIKKIGG